VTATRLSINELKLPIETPWYPWVNGDEVHNQMSFINFTDKMIIFIDVYSMHALSWMVQVGGYSVIYKGLTFATGRGAGHEVPEFQPSRALTLFKNFLEEKAFAKMIGFY